MEPRLKITVEDGKTTKTFIPWGDRIEYRKDISLEHFWEGDWRRKGQLQTHTVTWKVVVFDE